MVLFPALCAMYFPFFLQFGVVWPRFMQRKQPFALFNLSILSPTSTTFLQSWTQWPRDSQNTQKGSGPLAARRAGPLGFDCAWSVAAVGV